MRIGQSRPRALATSLAGLLTSGSDGVGVFPSPFKGDSDMCQPLADYSCGCSRGFKPHSHIHALADDQ